MIRPMLFVCLLYKNMVVWRKRLTLFDDCGLGALASMGALANRRFDFLGSTTKEASSSMELPYNKDS